MKKKFVRVMLFGALALSTVTYVGCKDYDDDIDKLQEQIDTINKKEPGVSTDAMNTAIQGAIASLKTQLETAIAGKADNAAVQALQTKVNELVAALDNKADASRITELVEQISALSAEVNSVKGSVEEIKANLEREIADLKGQIAELEKQLGEIPDTPGEGNASLVEKLNELNTQLSDAMNKLQAVEQTAQGNAEAIIKLTSEIAQLVDMQSKIEALEAANETFAKKTDLAGYVTTEALGAYMNSEDIKGYIDEQLVDYLTEAKIDGKVKESADAIYDYVNNTVKAGVMGQIEALNSSLEEYNAKLQGLIGDFDVYKKQQNTAYQDLVGRIEALEEYKNTTLSTLLSDVETLKGQAATLGTSVEGLVSDLSAAVNDIQTLQTQIAGCLTSTDLQPYLKKADLGTEIENYIGEAMKNNESAFKGIEDRLTALEVDIKGLKNMIQSVVFVPEYTDGQVQFSALRVNYLHPVTSSWVTETVAETNNAILKFRVSPKNAAAKFAEMYDVTFDAQEAKTRGNTSIFKTVSEPDLTEAADGIVKYTVTISAARSYVVCLNVKSKNASQTDKDFTDINSNYFPVVYKEKIFKNVRSVSPQGEGTTAITNLVYNKEGDQINYSENSYYEFNVSTNNTPAWEKLEGFDLSRFSTKYAKSSNGNPDFFTLDANTGVLTLTDDAFNKRSTIGKTVNVTSLVTIAGISGTSYQTTSTNARVTVKEEAETVPVVFNFDRKWEDVVNGSNISLDMAQLQNAIGLSPTEYSRLFNNGTPDRVATGTFSLNFSSNSATAIIDPTPNAVGEKKCVYTLNFAGMEKKVQVTVNLNITVPSEDKYKLKEDPLFLKDGVALFNPTITLSGDVVTGQIGTSKDLTALFRDYNATYTQVYDLAMKGVIDFEIIGNAGADINGSNELIYETSTYDGKDVKVKTTVSFGGVVIDAHEYVVRIAEPDKLSGTWKIAQNTPMNQSITNDNKTNGIELFNGFSWVDGRGKVMWKDGAALTDAQSADFNGVDPLNAYYLGEPTFTLEGDTEGFFTVDATGKITLTNAGQAINGLAQPYVVKVKATVKSPWGNVVGATDANTTVIVTIPRGFTY